MGRYYLELPQTQREDRAAALALPVCPVWLLKLIFTKIKMKYILQVPKSHQPYFGCLITMCGWYPLGDSHRHRMFPSQ